MKERGYLDDPFCLEFDAQVVSSRELADGNWGVILDKTYFYPTGGGQEHDTGSIAGVRVRGVTANEQGEIVHVVEGPIEGSRVVGKIDAERRFAHMQHHTGQHLLSQAFDRVLGLETVSAHISPDSPSTIDLLSGSIDEDSLTRVEDWANSIVFQDLRVKSYIVAESDVVSIPLRRPPKVKGSIRIVEIEGVDWSACGGTHCTRTGMIGPLKAVKVERRAERQRVYFVAGNRAIKYLQFCHKVVSQAVQRFNARPEDLVSLLDQKLEQSRLQDEALAKARLELLAHEANALADRAVPVRDLKLTKALFRDRPVADLRALADQMQDQKGIVGVIGSFDGTKLSLTVACGPDTGVNANSLIRQLLATVGGRGGGDARLAQGGGTASEAQVSALYSLIEENIQEQGMVR